MEEKLSSYRNLMLMALGVGIISSVTFHILTDDPGKHMREVNITHYHLIKPTVFILGLSKSLRLISLLLTIVGMH